ncbi:MAG: protein translocase subunit SecF, partial [Propionibacteriaceae bacterium]|nr:protein translocase subunit SecF [Propionibacteriaceae bacterium]
ICVVAIAVRGLNWGIEFKGGADFSVPKAITATSVQDATEAVQAAGLPDMGGITVTTIGSDQVRVQTRTLETAEVTELKEALAKWAGVEVDEVGYSLIGASWGQQITQAGIIALVVFLTLVAILIWIYFRDFKMSIAAIVALMHDLLVTIGVYALVGFDVTPATLIGALTILGYSLYDTVVVFDKIRENTRDLFNSNHTYSYLANKSVNQVLIRSLNTTIIGVLPVAAILFGGAFILGTGPLKDLGLALFVGMIAGTYSSIFLATPLLAQLREREPAMVEHRLKLERRAARKASRAAAIGKGEPVAEVPLTDEVPEVEPEQLSLVSAADLGVRRQPSRQSRSARKK